MFKSRSIASLSQSGISIHTRADLFHNLSLLLIDLSSNQPPAEKQRREKRKANWVYEKEKRNRKWQDSWKWTASGEECLWHANNEAKSCISDHCMSLDAQPSSWRALRTTKSPPFMNSASWLHRQRRAQAKLMEPALWSRLRNSWERRFFQTVNALAKKTKSYLDFK